MIKEKISNKELKRLIAFKSGKIDFEEVTEEDIMCIRDISLSSRLINGAESGIDLEVLKYFFSLERVRISNFEITDDVIQMLSELECLDTIEIVGCTFKDVDFTKLNGKLKRISFSKCEELPFKYPDVRDIRVIKSNIDFTNIDFTNVQNVFIQSSTIRNAHSLDDFCEIKKVNLDGTKLYDENGEEIKDIQVAEKTGYSHEEDVMLLDVR